MSYFEIAPPSLRHRHRTRSRASQRRRQQWGGQTKGYSAYPPTIALIKASDQRYMEHFDSNSQALGPGIYKEYIPLPMQSSMRDLLHQTLHLLT